MNKLSIKNSIVFKRGSRLLILSLLLVLLIMVLSIVMVFLFFYDFDNLESNVFFPTVIIIVFIVFAISLLFQIVFFKMFGGGKIVGIYSMGITEICFSQAIKRNAFFSAHILSNLIPLIILLPFAVLFWNGIMFFTGCIIFGNLIGYIPLYFAVFKYNKDDYFRFEQDGILRVYTLTNDDE